MQNIWETSGFSVSLGTVILAFHGGRGLWKPPEVVSLQHPPSWKHNLKKEQILTQVFVGRGSECFSQVNTPTLRSLTRLMLRAAPK